MMGRRGNPSEEAAGAGGRGKVTPVQIAFLVERYLEDKGYASTLASFRSEAATHVSRKRRRQRLPKGLLTLQQILEEYVTLKEQRIVLDREKQRVDAVIRGIDEAVQAYRSSAAPPRASKFLSAPSTPHAPLPPGVSFVPSHGHLATFQTRSPGSVPSLDSVSPTFPLNAGQQVAVLPLSGASPGSQLREPSSRASSAAKILFAQPPDSAPWQERPEETQRGSTKLVNVSSGPGSDIGEKAGTGEDDFDFSNLCFDLSSSDLHFLNIHLGPDGLAQAPVEEAESSQRLDREEPAGEKGSTGGGGAVTATRGVTKRVKLSNPGDPPSL
ncbi:uncharacterized protein LOC144707183 [Wolffia australiana]